MSIWRYANPAEFMRLSGALLPWSAALAVLALGGGLGWALFATPPDYQQGETIKIFFIHVPAATLAINVYLMMAVASAIGLVRRHHVSFLAAKAAAPIGAGFTLVAIVTGALWGEPIWGTWWVWDARLTSVLIMFFFYLGYMALWAAIDDPEKAAELSGVLCLVGAIFSVMSRYAVEFFFTLHQGASLSLDAETNVDPAFYYPVILCLIGFYAFFVALLLLRARTEIRLRRIRALRLRAARGAEQGETA